ncbi:MAG: hypothetical protein IT233_07505 [Bacteroidia bacterium]|nr:hypothetical protein [Bacteroidia bacterium]
MRPDLQLFNTHVEEAEFQIGVDNGMWGIVDDNPQRPTWPYVIIWVQASPKPNAPNMYYFRFELSGYSASAPTACPWDIDGNQRLPDNLWPKGNKFVSSVFRPSWNPNALYAPCDRLAMGGHGDWQARHPELWWQPTFKIDKYLHFLHRLLNSADYVNS